MDSDAPSLYGIPRPKTKPKHEISSSSALAFTSNLTALLAQTRPTTTTTARPRPAKGPRKDDIFTAHNKGALKRAATDVLSPHPQAHKTDIGTLDPATLHRSRRKMEEKARLYAAMKRGDHIPTGTADHAPLVDFDRKWAEADAAGEDLHAADTSSGSDDDASDDEAEPLVEFEDEFGRQRRGTRAEARREERRRQGVMNAEALLGEMSARPAMPAQLIYGDTVQVGAFDPEGHVAERMEELARKRDRSPTPPAGEFYDGSKEVRSKGVGFYQFSGVREERDEQMEALGKERDETVRRQAERKARKERREKDVEERRRAIKERRGKREADRFLEGLEEVGL
jgi:hypothetical protein